MGRLREKLFKGDSDRLITLEELDNLVETLSRMRVEERIRKLKLKPDRADVILPASIVLQMIAHTAKIKEVIIPQRRLEGRRAVGHGVQATGKCEHFAA